MSKPIPKVALIGLPNSGKSTLINRLCGRGTAITANEAHTTRDLNEGYCDWEGWYFKVIDTGGLVPKAEDKIQKQTQIRSWSAINEADVLVWVIDRRQNIDTITDEMIKRLWKTGKPFIIAVNKVDNVEHEKAVEEYVGLGSNDFINISAMSGIGLGDLCEKIIKQFEELDFEPNYVETEEIRNTTKDEKNKDYEKKGRKANIISYARDGSVVVTREESKEGKVSLFYTEATKDYRKNKIKNIFLDIDLVCTSDQNFWVVFAALDKVDSKKMWEYKNNQYEKAKLKSTFDFLEMTVELYKYLGLDCDQDEIVRLMRETNNITPEAKKFIGDLHEHEYKVFITTDRNHDSAEFFVKHNKISKYIEDIYSATSQGRLKSNPYYFEAIIKNEHTKANECILFDDKVVNIESARKAGAWGAQYTMGESNFDIELEKAELGFIERIPHVPKIILLGKPNVGKSSLFNQLIGFEKQIVTEIAGTTLSVNDYLINFDQEEPVLDEDTDNIAKKPKLSFNKALLLDSTGIRKPGKRSMGVETFATYKTVEEAHRSDIIVLMMDASQPISAQDQIIGGIAKESKKAVVVVANKVDLVDEDQRASFIKDFNFKLGFLKTEGFMWMSSLDQRKSETTVDQFWQNVDQALKERKKYIPKEEVRKLFNFLMKQKPPKKLRLKKRPVIYDLVYIGNEPPTFELLVKEKDRIHWSYLRFIENIIRKNWNFAGSGIKVRVVEIERRSVL